MSETSKTAKKITAGIGTVILLAICLLITTFALIYSTVSMENNFFHTGNVNINLNDGRPVIEEHEFIFEPGMTVKKSFFIENRGTCGVYYKIYFMNVDGGLADVLEVTLESGDEILFKGKIYEMNKENARAAHEMLGLNEKKELTVTFHFPEDRKNEVQNLTLSFDIGADAVQAKNNPDRLFE